MTQIFKKTPRQVEASQIIASPKRHVMFYGGSRSGKTFILVYAVIVRALLCKSRHLICRLRFNHAKTSLWLDTIPKVMSIAFPGVEAQLNNSDYVIRFPNGSEIWVAGLDDKQRTEKILGKEYSTIYFNECSQIPLTSVNMAITRLAEKNDLKKKLFYDENPPTKKHWSYAQFIEGVDPETWEPIDNSDYAHLVMNPKDNLENIDEEYIDKILNQLPEKDRKRFRDGEFTDESSGLIYYSFSRERNVQKVEWDKRLPIRIGMDFNVNPMTAVVYQIHGNIMKIISEIWLENSHTDEIAQHIVSKYGKGWEIIPDATGKALKTSAAGVSDHHILRSYGFKIPQVRNPFRGDRYNCVNGLLESGRIIIDPSCIKLIRDLQTLGYKEGTNLPDTTDKTLGHISDAVGYPAWYHFPVVRPNSDIMMLPRN